MPVVIISMREYPVHSPAHWAKFRNWWLLDAYSANDDTPCKKRQVITVPQFFDKSKTSSITTGSRSGMLTLEGILLSSSVTLPLIFAEIWTFITSQRKHFCRRFTCFFGVHSFVGDTIIYGGNRLERNFHPRDRIKENTGVQEHTMSLILKNKKKENTMTLTSFQKRLRFNEGPSLRAAIQHFSTRHLIYCENMDHRNT